MTPLTNRRWSVPQTILFATEIPVHQHVFAFALAQAKNAHAKLILFHAYDTLLVSASETSGVRYYDYAAAAKTEIHRLEPLAEKARQAGVEVEIIVRQGLAPHLINECAHEKNADRIVVGTRCPGTIGKIILGSVAEEVLRSSEIPVCVIGPNVGDKSFQGNKIKTVLLATGLHSTGFASVAIAAQIALDESAKLVLMHVLKASDSVKTLAKKRIEHIEADVLALVPAAIRSQIVVEAMVVSGDPFAEILFQTKAQHVDLLVLGAQEASIVATLTRRGVAYKVIADAPCPVLTLSAAFLARVRKDVAVVEHVGEPTTV